MSAKRRAGGRKAQSAGRAEPGQLSLGIDPGVNMGLVLARRKRPGEAGLNGYVIERHCTIKTDTKLTDEERTAIYGQELDRFLAGLSGVAVIERPWQTGPSGKRSAFTRSGRNVADIMFLASIYGVAFECCRARGLSVWTVPAPTGKLAKDWEAQKEYEAKAVYGRELKKHEAVAAMLALKGL